LNKKTGVTLLFFTTYSDLSIHETEVIAILAMLKN